MKKGMKNFLSVMGALALLAGIGVGVYYGNDTVHKWTDEQINKWKTGNSADTGTSSTPTSADSSEPVDSSTPVKTTMKLSATRYTFGAVKGAALEPASGYSITATLTGNPTVKSITWTTSDSTKVALSKTTTTSGEANTISASVAFGGQVTITAMSSVDNSIKQTCIVDYYSFAVADHFKITARAGVETVSAVKEVVGGTVKTSTPVEYMPGDGTYTKMDTAQGSNVLASGTTAASAVANSDYVFSICTNEKTIALTLNFFGSDGNAGFVHSHLENFTYSWSTTQSTATFERAPYLSSGTDISCIIAPNTKSTGKLVFNIDGKWNLEIMINSYTAPESISGLGDATLN